MKGENFKKDQNLIPLSINAAITFFTVPEKLYTDLIILERALFFIIKKNIYM